MLPDKVQKVSKVCMLPTLLEGTSFPNVVFRQVEVGLAYYFFCPNSDGREPLAVYRLLLILL